MQLNNLTKPQKRKIVHSLHKKEIEQFINFGDQLIMSDKKTHFDYVDFLLELLVDKKFVDTIYNKLTSNQITKNIYNHLVWIDTRMHTVDAIEYFGMKLKDITLKSSYDTHTEYLHGDSSLIQRIVTSNWRETHDFLELNSRFLELLKLFFPKPDDYELQNVTKLNETQYSYNNEQGVLQFINTIENMLKNHLIEFGKTNEKPLLKTLNILKSTSGIVEFYNEKKLDNLATDMLTRSFYYFYLKTKKFKAKEYDTLKDFITLQFDNQLNFFISRIFASHLKKVRYDSYYSSQNEMFDTAKFIANNLSSKDWVDVKNIKNFCIYRKLNLNIESNYKPDDYYIEGVDGKITGEYYYNELYYEPVLKAILFYLGALGVLDLKYNDPISPYDYKISAKGTNRISPWDGLKYVRLSKLGLYLLGINKTYEAKKIEKKETTIKFDQYKPIITIDEEDTIMIAQLDPFCEKYDTNRYILSYVKLFKDCKNSKALNMKIDRFYKIFTNKPTKVFDDFFNEIKANSNMIKRDLKLITIELKNNKKLLNLFMTNKKLQEFTIKASGYRVLVAKDDIPKLTKIIKENGFFLEF